MNLPFVRAGSPAAGPADFMRRVERATFLVVDDFETMRRVTINQLRQLGARRILEAADGMEALKILEREEVTIVISDWNMPNMSGLELLQAVRGHAKLAGVPFMMVTAEAERNRVHHAVQAGVSELLVKPYTAAVFADRLERAMARKIHAPKAPPPALSTSSATSEPTLTAPVMPERFTILVVDDTPDNLHLISSVFKEEYKVKIANSGDRALAVCQTDSPPDLVLLDIMMPGMDGFEVAAKLRSHPSSEHIPIIFVTAMTDDAARLRGMELGAVDFVSKPIAPDVLKLRVKNFMRYIALHRQLQASYDAILEVARLREEVEHITRHDLKGPLAGVIGLIQHVAGDGHIRGEDYEQLRLAEETTLEVVNMINLSADMFKIEAGRYELHAKPLMIGQILLRVAAISRKAYASKNVEIDVALPEGVPLDLLVASGESMFCYSVFQNLVKNACEAAPVGSTVEIALQAGSAMVTTIRNQGKVPIEIRERFFEKYVTSGKNGGTGLGTYSAKLLIEAQGGTIAMSTDDIEGITALTVSLPADAA